MTTAPKQDPNDFDVRTLVEKPDIRSWDLGGKDRTLKIVRVVPGSVYSMEKKTHKSMPMLYLAGPSGPWPKPLGLNATNLATIGAMYGFKAKNWIGKLVTLYPDRTTFGKKMVDCVRIRPTAPGVNAAIDDMPDVPEDKDARREQEEAARAVESEGDHG